MPDLTALEIAQQFGYEPFKEEDLDKQFQVEETYDKANKQGKELTSGHVYRNAQGVLRLYWEPSEEHPTYGPDDQGYSYAYTVTGWYDVPSNRDVEDMCIDGTAVDPCGETELETDHPDSWTRLLGLV